MRILRPDWPVREPTALGVQAASAAEVRVCAAVTLRQGGVSVGPYASLNLGSHVGDDPLAVAQNRQRLRAELALPSEPVWLAQVHGIDVVDADRDVAWPAQADAAVTRRPGRVLAVLVADCLPVLFARRDGGAVAVAHAGWRGLAAGVLEATVRALDCPPEALLAWLGPAIGPAHFEVGAEVRAAFCAHDRAAEAAFEGNARGRWQCDLHRLARLRLGALGLAAVHGEPRCTHADAQSFYSFRRDGITGRMAALIWLAPP